jgi:RNA polymerase primary sigma factor
MRQLRISKSITNRDSQSLDKYLVEIGKIDLINAEEEIVLAQLIRQGDRRALDRLTKANLRFVVSVAKQYQSQGLTLEDLINEGNLGLIKAAQKFDETKGFKFISYAVWWIRQSIMQSIAEKSRIVRLPLNKVGSLNKISKAFSELEQEYEREPSSEELALLLNVTMEEIDATISYSSKHVSVDTPIGENEDGTLLDVMSSSDLDGVSYQMEHHDSLKIELDRSLKTLTEKQSDILKLYFGIDQKSSMSVEDIAYKYNLTKERVRQIRDTAIQRLRTNSKSKLLQKYLG